MKAKFSHIRSAALVATGLLALGAGGTAFAGECPADQVKAGARTSGETMPVGVTDTVIASIDLSAKGKEFEGKQLRLRKLVIAPGGVVPWHDHKTRPANIYVLTGTIEEYRSTCAVPIVHKQGEVTAEFGADLAHWWKNTSSAPVELLSADIFETKAQDDHMM